MHPYRQPADLKCLVGRQGLTNGGWELIDDRGHSGYPKGQGALWARCVAYFWAVIESALSLKRMMLSLPDAGHPM